jgi:hypothetical protein
MSFCAVQDVIDKTGTVLDSTTITNLVESGARKIRIRLKEENLSTNPNPAPDELIEANAHFSAAMALYRAMVDGTLPSSQSIDGASASVNVEKVIEGHEIEGEKYLSGYIQKTAGAVPLVRVVGRSGERVGEYETMTEAEEEET